MNLYILFIFYHKNNFIKLINYKCRWVIINKGGLKLPSNNRQDNSH